MVQTGVFEPNSSFSDWKEKQNEIIGEIGNNNCMHTDLPQPDSNFRPWGKMFVKYHILRKTGATDKKKLIISDYIQIPEVHCTHEINT